MTQQNLIWYLRVSHFLMIPFLKQKNRFDRIITWPDKYLALLNDFQMKRWHHSLLTHQYICELFGMFCWNSDYVYVELRGFVFGGAGTITFKGIFIKSILNRSFSRSEELFGPSRSLEWKQPTLSSLWGYPLFLIFFLLC